MSLVLRFVVVTALACAGCGFTQQEVLCERAGTHLAGCCPGYNVRSLPCSSTEELSRCILASSCSTIVEQGFCDQARIAELQSTLCP